MYEFTAAINPKSASAQSPSERIRMKNTPMIALNRVSVFAATMDATERSAQSGGAAPDPSAGESATADDNHDT